MSRQRRHGEVAVVYKSKTITDHRGNVMVTVDETQPQEVRVAAIPQRSSIASVPGESPINIVRLLLPPDVDVSEWARVDFRGGQWDIVSSPSLHHGSRRSRHISIDVRERTVT